MRRLILAALLAPTYALAQGPVDMTADEFKMYRQWQKAMNDPRVQKMKPESRNGAIAKDARFKVKEMEAAVAKGEAAGDLKAACEGAIKQALTSTDVGGRLGTIEVDTSEPHAVAYVQWMNIDPQQLEEEASHAAVSTAKACPLLSTIQVWAQDQSAPKTRVFQALISQTAAARINPDRIKDFADTRYIRLFENVKNAANGDVIVPEGSPAAAPSEGAAQ